MQKSFVDGKPLIVEGSHLDPEVYLKVIKLPDGTERFEVITPEPENEEEDQEESSPVKAMRSQMKKLDQSRSLIIPFLLTITPEAHALCVESRLNQGY